VKLEGEPTGTLNWNRERATGTSNIRTRNDSFSVLVTYTMIGAVFVDMFVIHMPFFIVPFFLGVVIVMVAMLCRQ
jgi:hypothetical protein